MHGLRVTLWERQPVQSVSHGETDATTRQQSQHKMSGGSHHRLQFVVQSDRSVCQNTVAVVESAVNESSHERSDRERRTDAVLGAVGCGSSRLM